MYFGIYFDIAFGVGAMASLTLNCFYVPIRVPKICC